MKIGKLDIDRSSFEQVVKDFHSESLVKNIRFDIGDGWMPIIFSVLETFSEAGLSEYVQLTHVYSSFGVLIIKYKKTKYLEAERRDMLQSIISEILQTAQLSSLQSCEHCGKRKGSEPKISEIGAHGLCEKCVTEMEQRTLCSHLPAKLLKS